MFDLIPFAARPHDLFDNFDRHFWRDMNSMTQDFRTDIVEEDDRYVIECELPGFTREDISVDVENDRLIISARREHKDDGRKYIHRERTSAAYQRSFAISNIRTDAISAAYTDGVLSLTLPKEQPKEAQSRKIEIA